MDLFRLDGSVAFVTGAGSGIGRRIAVGLAEAGADVGCFDLPESTGVQDTIDRIEALDRKSMRLKGDVTQRETLADALTKLEGQIGPVSIAVNSAGIAKRGPSRGDE